MVLIKGINLTEDIYSTHRMLVDDLLLGGENNKEEWSQIYVILNEFGMATCLFMNKDKTSCSIYYGDLSYV